MTITIQVTAIAGTLGKVTFNTAYGLYGTVTANDSVSYGIQALMKVQPDMSVPVP